MALDELRSEIDKIDNEIFALFAKRMNLSDDIARVKLDEGLSILNSSREKEILDKVKGLTPADYAQYAVSLCSYIMELSRSRQRSILINEGKRDFRFKNEIRNNHKEKRNPCVVVQGIPGCYSAMAAAKMYDGCKIIFVETDDEATYSLHDGSADYGVLPVSSFASGSAIDAYDMMINNNFKIIKSVSCHVEYSLLGIRGSALNDIKIVYSSPSAFPQCEPFFNKHCRFNKCPFVNTAMAAREVAYLGDKTKAALASPECAHLYGLDVLAESVQKPDTRFTQFVSISKKLEIHDDADKISLVFALPHVTGSLYRILSRFALCGYNLTNIESRRNPHNPLEYYFYIDFGGKISSPQTMNLLGSLRDELPFFYFLGNYNKIDA